MWTDLFAALALVLVIEGILPFVAPDAWRNTMRRMMEMETRALRSAGLISMLAGLALLYLIR